MSTVISEFLALFGSSGDALVDFSFSILIFSLFFAAFVRIVIGIFKL